MRLLLDAHVVIWAIYEPEFLSERVQELLKDRTNELFFSYASLQEVLNKVGRGKLRLTNGSVADAFLRIQGLGVQFLAFSVEEIVMAAGLPHHHSDPFDRILIAQANVQELTLVTLDEDIRKYPVRLLWE